ncbi:MAG: DUF6728 family protein [Cyclobacteriaceae bacterium]
MNSNKNSESTVKEYFKLGEFFGYFFRKKDPNRPTNFNLRMMHGINKISIIMFLAGIIFLIIKNLG